MIGDAAIWYDDASLSRLSREGFDELCEWAIRERCDRVFLWNAVLAAPDSQFHHSGEGEVTRRFAVAASFFPHFAWGIPMCFVVVLAGILAASERPLDDAHAAMSLFGSLGITALFALVAYRLLGRREQRIQVGANGECRLIDSTTGSLFRVPVVTEEPVIEAWPIQLTIVAHRAEWISGILVRTATRVVAFPSNPELIWLFRNQNLTRDPLPCQDKDVSLLVRRYAASSFAVLRGSYISAK